MGPLTNKKRGNTGGTEISGFYASKCAELGIQPLPELHAALASGSSACRLGPTGPLDDRDIEALSLALAHSGIVDLSLERLQMPEEGWLALTSAANACGLRCLSMNSCPLGGYTSLIAAAIGRLTSVQWLRLSNADLDGQFVSGLVQTPLLSGKSKLLRLELCHNNIGCSGATAIAHAMVTNGVNLKFLDLSYNGIGDDGARALGFALSGARKGSVHRTAGVEILEMEGNQIGDMGGIALGVALLNAPLLMRANLGRNNLGDAAMHAVAESLSHGATGLKELLLERNGAGEESLITLLEAATTHGHLYQLDIRGMTLHAASSKVACQMIRAHRSMQSLKMDVAVPQHAADLARALRSNTRLVELVLGGQVGESALGDIQRLLARNQNPELAEAEAAASLEPAAAPVVGTSSFKVPSSAAESEPARPQSAAPKKNTKPAAGRGAYRPASAQPTARSGPLKPHVNVSDQRVLNPKTPNIGRRGTYCGKYQSDTKDIMTSVVGGGAQAMAGEIFRKCDRNSSNYLEREEFPAALKMSGLLEEAKAQGAGYVDFLFNKADKNRDGKLSVHEWGEYFAVEMAKCSVDNRRQKLDIPESFQAAVPRGYLHHPELKEVFAGFCAFGYGHGATRQGHTAKMNGFQFRKLMRDAGIMHDTGVGGSEPKGRLSPTSIDVIFAKANKYNWRVRNLTYPSFLECLALVAFEVKKSFADVVRMMGVEPLEGEPQEFGEDEPRYNVTPAVKSKQGGSKQKQRARAQYEKMSPDKYEAAREVKAPEAPGPAAAPAAPAGGIDTAALAALLSQQIRSEMEALRGGIEQRLSNIEQRVMAHEQMISPKTSMKLSFEEGDSVRQFSDQIDALSEAVTKAVMSPRQGGAGGAPQMDAVMTDLNSRLQQRGLQA
eukprot:jgi/Tetstr1/465499/TSEL_000882.t1